MTKNYDTIENQVNSESKDDLGYREYISKLSITDERSGDTIVIPYENIINTYRDYLKDYVVEEELNDEMYMKYKQNPQTISEALYGTIHLWHTILELNGCISRLDLVGKKIKYYNPTVIETLLNEVLLKHDQVNSINIY